MNTTTSSEDDKEKEGGTKNKANKRRKRQRDDLFNQTFLSSRAGSLSLTNRIPFPTKLFQMLEDLEHAGQKSIASWSSDGTSFRVHDSKAFVENVMPHYFRQSKFKSFQRQLHLYGFTRITDGLHKGSYFHSAFLRSNRELSKDMMPLKRVKRDDDQEDSQPEALSLSSKRSQDDPVTQAGDEGAHETSGASRKKMPKKKQQRRASNSGIETTGSGGDTKQKTMTTAQTRASNDDILDQHYHDRSALMYFPPENQLLSSSILPLSHRGGPSSIPEGAVLSSRPVPQEVTTLQAQDEQLQQESCIIAYNSSLSSEEDGKKAAIERTSEGTADSNLNIVSTHHHQDQQQRNPQHQRVSLLPDPSNPSGMVALENQFYPPVDRFIALPEGSRGRTARAGATQQVDPSTSSISFLPHPSSLSTSLATRSTSALETSDGHVIPKPHQQIISVAALSRRESSTQSPPVETTKQQDPLASGRPPSPLFTLLPQQTSRSSFSGNVYREEIFQDASPLQHERGLFQYYMINQQQQQQQQQQQPQQPQQYEMPIPPVVNNPTGGQPFNTVPTTTTTAVTNMYLAFQQQMNESFILALLQQQQQQQILLQSRPQQGEDFRQTPRNDNDGGAARLSPSSAFSSVLPYQASMVQQVNQASSAEHHTSPSAPFVPSSLSLFNFQDPPPRITTSRPNSVASNSYLVPSPFMFPTEHRHRQPSSSPTGNTAPIMTGGNTLLPVGHSSRMMAPSLHHHHRPSQNDDEERLCLPPPPAAPPPRRSGEDPLPQKQSMASSLYTTKREASAQSGSSSTIARMEEVPTNSQHQVEGTANQQHRQLGPQQEGGTDHPGFGGVDDPRRQVSSAQLHQQSLSNDQQQDVSPANSGTSFDSSLFEPNPFYQ